MSEPTSFWASIRRARVIQVLAVYLGASWLVVQISHTLVGALALPAWVTPVAIILLLVGLVVILATAWVQSLPDTAAREAAGELPTDWQIAPRDVVSSLRAGRMPHLTWGRAITGGVVVLALLFGGAGTYMGLTRGGARLGPAAATVSEAADGIAVVPFEVRGQDLDIWREGMMDLLTSGLDGVGGFRTIDSRTVMARWHEQGAGRARVRAAAAEAADSIEAERLNGEADVIEGAAAWRGGDLRRGRELLEPRTRIAGPAGERARLELGWLEAEAGRPGEALRHFRATLRSFTRASALYGAATMHEQLGQPNEARRYWASFVALTEHGDDLPRIREARQALARALQEPR